ncbi:hypothetical protein F444_06558 [Phytophthora nicotianae P1976]|uniref:Uncharacterized protein n=1 Tax=Phytophthora nicotianae P1976 TaxID=1317066 RepID=A0A081AI00_PHYNI|nr:hypothetical protein F444_06558 [Phytophthora nicotianae P1976]
MGSDDDRPPRGECPECSKLVSKSNMAKHRKICGKKKPRKSRKAINRDSYVRNKDKILRKRQEYRLADQFRRLSAARRKLAELEPHEIDVEAVERTAWTPVTPSNILYGVSKDPDVFAYFITELRNRCKSRHGRGPTMLSPKELYRAAILELHPDKLTALRNKFGERFEEVATYWSRPTI